MIEIVGFPNYKITSDGRVYCVKSKIFKRPKPGFKKYLRIELWKDGERFHRWIHRLVCSHYVGSCTDKHVHHKNGNYLDNRARNLVPLTPAEHYEAHRKLKIKQARERAKQLRESCPF